MARIDRCSKVTHAKSPVNHDADMGAHEGAPAGGIPDGADPTGRNGSQLRSTDSAHEGPEIRQLKTAGQKTGRSHGGLGHPRKFGLGEARFGGARRWKSADSPGLVAGHRPGAP